VNNYCSRVKKAPSLVNFGCNSTQPSEENAKLRIEVQKASLADKLARLDHNLIGEKPV
jgi:hypothetical protein